MYDSGFTGQFIEVQEAHKGTSPDRDWVYFRRDTTWNYLCAGVPPALDTERLYVISLSDSVFEPQTVVHTYAIDSALATNLLSALAADREQAENATEPSVYTVENSDWIERVKSQLAELAVMVRIKLAEWHFWKLY